jgi:hypothetical protein
MIQYVENGPCIHDLPIENGYFFHINVSLNKAKSLVNARPSFLLGCASHESRMYSGLSKKPLDPY